MGIRPFGVLDDRKLILNYPRPLLRGSSPLRLASRHIFFRFEPSKMTQRQGQKIWTEYCTAELSGKYCVQGEGNRGGLASRRREAAESRGSPDAAQPPRSSARRKPQHGGANQESPIPARRSRSDRTPSALDSSCVPAGNPKVQCSGFWGRCLAQLET